MPSSSGISAAIAPRKTISSRTVRIGNAISSARVRSSRVSSLTSLKLTPKPPRPTSSGLSPIRSRASSAASPPSLSMSCVDSAAAIDERLAVALDQRGGRLAVAQRVEDVADEARVAQRGGDPVDLVADRRARHVEPAAARVAHEHDDPGAGVVAELAAQELRRALALGGGVGEAGRLEVVLDVVAECARARDEDADEREHELRLAPRQRCDPVEHVGATLQARRDVAGRDFQAAVSGRAGS